MINIVFFGTPDFAGKFLSELYNDDELNIEAIVCQPDKPVGRKKIITKPATKVFAEENNIKVLQPDNLRKSNLVEELKKLEIDLFVIIAYGKIIPQEILDIPKLGSINVHPSLLPKYRGPSPIQSAILNQESETGISIMLIDDKMDHGPILKQEKILMNDNETSISLRERVTKIGRTLLIDTIKQYVASELQPVEQNHNEVTFCKMLTKADGKINWQQSARAINAQLNALIEWPGVFTIWKHDNHETIIKIHKIKISEQQIEPGKVEIDENKMFIGTKTKALEIIELQPQNSSKMSGESFIQGHRDINKSILG